MYTIMDTVARHEFEEVFWYSSGLTTETASRKSTFVFEGYVDQSGLSGSVHFAVRRGGARCRRKRTVCVRVVATCLSSLAALDGGWLILLASTV